MKICENCGTTNGNDDKNCKKCGHPLFSAANQFATSVVRRPIVNRPISNAIQPPRPQFGNVQPNSQPIPQEDKPIPQEKKVQGPTSQENKKDTSKQQISSEVGYNQQKQMVNRPISAQPNVKEKQRPQMGQQTAEMQRPAKPKVPVKQSQSRTASQQISFSAIEKEDENDVQYFNPDEIDEENLAPIPNKVNQQSQKNMQKPVSMKANDPDFPLKPIAPSNDPIKFIVPHPASHSQSFFNRNKAISEKTGINQQVSQKSSDLEEEEGEEEEEETFNPNKVEIQSNQKKVYQKPAPNKNVDSKQKSNSQYSQENAYQPRQQISNQYSQNQQSIRTRSVDPDKFEMAMTDALTTLKTKFGSAFAKTSKAKKTFEEEEIEVQKPQISVPESLNDILISLEDLDLSIEASALVDIEGNILVSATSKRISEPLIATIAQTLGNISQDMIDALDSGTMSFIALHASKGILFLSPVLKRVFLLLLTGPEAKSGVINIARLKVKKQMDLFYAKKNLSKSPI